MIANVNTNQSHLIKQFLEELTELKKEFDTDQQIQMYLQWLTLQELRFVSDDTREINNKITTE